MTKVRISHWCVASAVVLSLGACSGSGAATTSTTRAQSSPPATSASQDSVAASAMAVCSGAAGRVVSTARQLADALKKAAPGTRITLAPGTYDGHFVASTPGTKAAPVVLCGPRTSVLNGGSLKSGYTFHLDHASYWRVEGFTIEGGQKGVVADASSYDLIDGLYVHDIGDEGIHLRDFSSHDTVSRNVVSHTGLHKSFYGEGIYIGSAHSNWCRYSNCKVDQSNADTIEGNYISYTTAENIDIKEGTTGGVIEGNHLNGTGMDPASATSWINVKGNGWKIINNVGAHSVQDGFSDHQVYQGWGLNNYFAGNNLAVNGPGYGFHIAGERLHASVSCNNKVTGASRGFSNQSCTG